MTTPIRCIIIDDKPLAIEIIRNYIERVSFLSLARTTTNPLEALPWLDQQLADLVFLDIQMPELTGVQFMKIAESKVGIILTTAYAEYALEGFEHQALDYLLKPFSFERFYKSVLKAKEWLLKTQIELVEESNYLNPDRDFLFIRSNNRLVKVFFSDVTHAEAMQNYSILHTIEKKIITLQPLKQIEAQLPQNKFVRVHKSYVVNIRKIDEVVRNIIIIGKTEIPIGETHQNAFFKILKQP